MTKIAHEAPSVGTGTVTLKAPETNENRELSLPDRNCSLAGTDEVDTVQSSVVMGVNDIVNGQFQIAQTGTAFVSPTSGTYDLDGWIRHGYGTHTVTVSQVAGSVTGSYARESNVTTALTTLDVSNYEMGETRLLGYDCVKYINQPFVIAAKITSGVTGIHCIALRTNTHSFIHETNILSANTPQDVVIPVPMGVPSLNSSTNQYGFNIGFTQATGTTFQTTTTGEWVAGNFIGTPNQVNGLSTVGNKLTIEDVRINLGTVPLPNVTPYDAELARCELYQEVLNYVPNTPMAQGGADSTTAFVGLMKFKTKIAGTPSITFEGAAGDYLIRKGNPVQFIVVSVLPSASSVQGNPGSCYVTAVVAGGLNADGPCSLRSSVARKITIKAQL